MKRAVRVGFILVAGVVASFLLVPSRALAVPSYTREYGVSCTGCHTMWGSLNVAGATFRLSGYRAMNGRDLTPTEKPIELANGALTMPGTFPASVITGAGLEYRREDRGASAGDHTVQNGSNLTIMDASIFLTGPLGKHLSFFIEFPMFESKAWEFTPTGPGEANDRPVGSTQLRTEKPVFEVAKFWWNSVLGDAAPRDTLNLLGGITHLPLAYPSGKVRLAVNQYLVFERRGLDYISPVKLDALFAPETADGTFRLGEPQGMVEVNGMIVPGAPVTEVGKRQTFWLEYHLGLTNASNAVSDTNGSKGVYGRYVMRWYNQSLGGFAFYASDISSDAQRAEGSASGVINPAKFANSTVRAGPDATLSLAPLGIPVNLENCVLYNRESDPTGFGKEFVWWGGFHQLNWFVSKKAVTYLRYDWIDGKSYDDTAAGGRTKADPKEWDIIAGVQVLALENLKLIGEYRHHEFEDRASTPQKATLTDDGFTLRAMVGF
jgi:hypothetical protein